MVEIPAGNPAKPTGNDGRTLLERMNGGHHESLALWGLSHLDIPRDAVMLDIGCGGGANLKRLLDQAENGTVYGIDYSPVSVELSSETCAAEIARGICEVREGDVAELPYDDGQFDIVCAFETVYFWHDMFEALMQVRRVLKPEGRFLICNEANGATPEMYEEADTIEGMVMYTAAELKLLLIGCGFEIETVDDEGETGRIVVIAGKSADSAR